MHRECKYIVNETYLMVPFMSRSLSYTNLMTSKLKFELQGLRNMVYVKHYMGRINTRQISVKNSDLQMGFPMTITCR